MALRRALLRSAEISPDRKIHNESSCSSPADGTPRSPANDTRTSPAEESPRSRCSGTSRSSPGGLSDSGQQPHPRNMENEIDGLDNKIMLYIGCFSMNGMSEGWYHGPEGPKLILEKLAETEEYKTVTEKMVKERIGKLEQMVKDYHEKRRSSLPHQKRMLYVFSNVAREYYETVPETPQSSGKRTALVSEELEAPSSKRPRSESVDMVMYLSNPDAASKLFSSGFGMECCTSRAQRLFQDDSHMLYSALILLRQNIEIRQSFMTLEESYARGYIEHELKDSGML